MLCDLIWQATLRSSRDGRSVKSFLYAGLTFTELATENEMLQITAQMRDLLQIGRSSLNACRSSLKCKAIFITTNVKSTDSKEIEI